MGAVQQARDAKLGRQVAIKESTGALAAETDGIVLSMGQKRTVSFLRRLLRGAAALLIWVTHCLVFAAPTVADDGIDWQADLDALLIGLEERHPNPYHAVSREEFLIGLAAVREKARSSAPAEDVVVSIASLVASLGETHTYLDWPTAEARVPFRRYPFRARRFSDGLFVTGAGPGLEGLIGSRIAAFGDRPVEGVLDAVAEVTGADNPWTHHVLGPRRVSIVELMISLGAAEPDGRLRLSLIAPDGEGFEEEIDPAQTSAEPIDARPAEARATSLFWKEPDRSAWFEASEDGRLYLQFNRVADGEDESLAELARRLGKAIDEPAPERIVVDLRRNIGGNSLLARPLIRELISSPAALHNGGIVVLIGPSTISAATVFAEELSHLAEVAFVGEPTGSNRNQWGDNTFFELPSSGVEISVSTAFYQTGGPYAQGPIEPDVWVGMSGRDYFDLVDPALEVALRYEPDPPIPKVYSAAAGRGEDPLSALTNFVTAPDRRFRDFERELRLLAREVSEAGQPEVALSICDLLVAHHPTRARAFMARAQQLEILGRLREAVAAWDEALERLATDRSLYPDLSRRLRAVAMAERERLLTTLADDEAG